MSSRRRKKQRSGSPIRDYDEEFFQIVLASWYILVFAIFSPVLNQAFDESISRLLLMILTTGIVGNCVLRLIYFLLKFTEPTSADKIAKDMRRYFKPQDPKSQSEKSSSKKSP